MDRVVTLYRHEIRGFSLVETLTVIGLTAIVSLVAVPRCSDLMNEYRLMSAANQLSFEITRARMQAIGQNRFVRLRMLEGGQYVREVSNDNVTYTPDGTIVQLPSGLTVTTGAGGPPTFNRSGIAPSATSLTLQNEGGLKILQMNVLGRVAISSTVPES